MVRTESTSMPPGAAAPAFTLPDTVSGEAFSLSERQGDPVLVIFMCNHCPYVVHILEPLSELASRWREQGIATVAISANDIRTHPADAPEHMTSLARRYGFDFPYCYDESQDVARAYGAVCTPDIFLFDAGHALFYHGQFDETRPGQGRAHGADLAAAGDALLAGQAPIRDASPSVGCSIKWKASAREET